MRKAFVYPIAAILVMIEFIFKIIVLILLFIYNLLCETIFYPIAKRGHSTFFYYLVDWAISGTKNYFLASWICHLYDL